MPGLSRVTWGRITKNMTIEEFGMWLWRRMEKISWTAKVSNSKVLSRVMEDRCIINMIKQQKCEWLGHVLHHDVLLRDLLEGGMLGKRTRERKRLELMSNQHMLWRNFLRVSKEESWRRMSVRSVRDESQWPDKYCSTPEEDCYHKPQQLQHCISSQVKLPLMTEWPSE